MKPPLPHSYWVDAGRFLAGEHPSGDSDTQTLERLELLLAAENAEGEDGEVDVVGPEGEVDHGVVARVIGGVEVEHHHLRR